MAFHLFDGEKEILVVRKSFVVFIFQTCGFAVLFFGLPLLVAFISHHSIHLTFSGASSFVPVLLIGLWHLFIWIVYFVRLTNFFLDVWVVTTERIVDIDQKSLFARNIASLPLDKVEDVTADVSGFFPTFFGYGTLSVQTAGEKREFTIQCAHRPLHARDVIMKEYRAYRERVQKVEVVQ